MMQVSERDALKAIVADPYGCPFCDSGKLRDPEKGHTFGCGYRLAEAALEGPDFRIVSADLTQMLLRCTKHLPEDDKYRVQALDYIKRRGLVSPLR